MVRLDFQGPVQMGRGLVEMVLARQGVTQLAVGLGVVGLDAEHGLVVGGRLVQPALAGQDVAQVAVASAV